VLVNTKDNMRVVQEEIFGPVVTAIPFDNPEELTPRANDTVYGLAAGIWTKDHFEGASSSIRAARRNRVDQLLQHLRRGTAVWRLQTVRGGTRDGQRRSRTLHADQVGVCAAVVP